MQVSNFVEMLLLQQNLYMLETRFFTAQNFDKYNKISPILWRNTITNQVRFVLRVCPITIIGYALRQKYSVGKVFNSKC